MLSVEPALGRKHRSIVSRYSYRGGIARVAAGDKPLFWCVNCTLGWAGRRACDEDCWRT
jgi:hypothetical protein